MKHNPYIGPRPYERQDRDNFYGRTREARELCALIRSEREVLFYAQSGAGKTSLLNASVIPTLEEQDFVVLPVARVGSELPLEVAADEVANVFVFSTLLTLAGEDADPQALLPQTLYDYLAPLCDVRVSGEEDTGAGGADSAGNEDTALCPVVLILDQFEELFTTHRERWPEAEGFFRQMREALDALPNLGVVLAMREDHVAAIDPYAPHFPRRLRARFRMERLGPKGALVAVKRPAENAGCRYDSGVAERLVDNLRRIKVQRPPSVPPNGGEEKGGTEGGTEGGILGPYVEPVQLQVVCSRLWEQLPEQEDHAIQWEEVEQYGDIDRALIDFYESAVAAAVVQGGVNERQVRRWFGEELITQAETRGLVLRGDAETADLPNEAVDVLEEAHIIRAERRAGARWYELAHDRLVEPVLRANREWRLTYHNPLAEPTQRWLDAGRDPHKLLKGELLEDALHYTRKHPDDVIAEEGEFLVECLCQRTREREQARQKARRRRNMILVTAGVMMVLLALTVLAGWSAINATRARKTAVQAEVKAKQQAQIAFSRQLAAQSAASLDSALDLASLLSVAAYNITTTTEARSSLLSSLQHSPQVLTFLHDYTGWVQSVAFSRDGKTLAAGGRDNTIVLWDVSDPHTPVLLGDPLTEHVAWVSSIAFHPDRDLMASGDNQGNLILWDVSDPSIPELIFKQQAHTGDVECVVFSPDGQLMASGGGDGNIILWDVAEAVPQESIHTLSTQIRITSLAFSPDGQTLASGNVSAGIALWDVSAPREAAQLGEFQVNFGGELLSLAFSPDGQTLAAGGFSQKIGLWNVTDPRQPFRDRWLEGQGAVNSMTFSSNGKILASCGTDGNVILWDMSLSSLVLSQPEQTPLIGHAGSVSSVAFSPDGQTLASGSDGKVILWTSDIGGALSLSHIEDKYGNSMVFSPDGHTLAVSSRNAVELLDVVPLSTGAPSITLTEYGSVSPVVFTPDAQTLVAAGSCGERDTNNYCLQGGIAVWNITNPHAPAQLISFTGHTDAVAHVALSPDGQTLASVGYDDTIILWDIAGPRTPIQSTTLTEQVDDIQSIVFSPSGQLLAVGECGTRGEYGGLCEQSRIRLWDLGTPRDAMQVITLTGHTSYVYSVAFSPDGQTLASGSADYTIILWNISNLNEIEMRGPPLDQHTSFVTEVIFSPDGKTLASGDGAGKIFLWDVSDLRSVTALGTPLLGYKGQVGSIAFSPDSKTLASEALGTIVLWDVDVASWQSLTCQRAGRNLTQAEWRRYMGYDTPYRKTCP